MYNRRTTNPGGGGSLSELSLITYSLFLITFNYLDSDVIPFASTSKTVKDTRNHITKEYDWLGPDLTQNTQGWYILILPEVLIAPILLQSSS